MRILWILNFMYGFKFNILNIGVVCKKTYYTLFSLIIKNYYVMKKYTIFYFLFSSVWLCAQTREKDSDTTNLTFTIAPTVGLHFNTYNKNLYQLNDILDKQNIPTLIPVLNATGTAFIVKNGKLSIFSEISFVTSTVLSRPLTDQDKLAPKLKGVNFRSIVTKTIWSKNRFRIEGGFGISTSRYNFRLVNRRGSQIPFDSIIKNPDQSFASLDYTQKTSNFNIEGRLGMVYDTKWFKKAFGAYEFALYINYSQALFTSKTWLATDTNGRVKGFPSVDFSNCYFQFVNSLYPRLSNKKSTR